MHPHVQHRHAKMLRLQKRQDDRGQKSHTGHRRQTLLFRGEREKSQLCRPVSHILEKTGLCPGKRTRHKTDIRKSLRLRLRKRQNHKEPGAVIPLHVLLQRQRHIEKKDRPE